MFRRRITQKHKALRPLLSLQAICRSLHTDKIHKNKIHSYNELEELTGRHNV